ncbi:uncharacterized protein BXZ73DRAFT_1106, partial [Epithele typhae]|uniref:uncharacterized protein n=1 Tax=Epithele typhae TaxID=378194 RepID=UPI0020075820
VPLRTLLALTHVSQKWRTIAIGYPILWTHTDCHDRAQFIAFMQRSQELPISLVVHHDDIIFSGYRQALSAVSFMEVITPITSRLRTLKVTFTRVNGELPDWLVTAVPGLQLDYLLLTVDATDVWRSPHHGNTKALFAEQVSRVKALRLDGVAGWELSTRFPNLTHLLFSGAKFRTVDRIADLLSYIPSLEVLSFNRVSPPGAIQQRSSRKVSLQRLRTVSFSDSEAAALQLIDDL